MNRIQHTNLGLYRRLQALNKIPEKSFYVFNNEFHVETFVSRSSGESDKDWEIRLFNTALTWYTNHIVQNFTNISVLALYETEPEVLNGVSATTIFDYVKSLILYDELVDLLVFGDVKNAAALSCLESHVSYPEYVSSIHINLGIKTGKYQVGIYYQNPDDYMAGTVVLKTSQLTFTVLGILNINRAFTGDLVAIEKVSSIPNMDIRVRIDEGCDFEIFNLPETEKVGFDEKYCKIVGVVRRNWKQYCGVLLRETSLDDYYLFRPIDRRVPLILFESKRKGLIENKRICISVDNWAANHRYPRGHLVRILGDVNDLNTESESILFERRVPFSKFSQSVLDCLPVASGNANMMNRPECDVEKVLVNQPDRLDLRHLNICSIDPPGCTDIDDALHIRVLASDKGYEEYEVGIHIADVTHYVVPGTAIDKEAYRRGTTVYLVNRRVDMLPELLSSNLCSLRPNEDRLAFSVLCYMDSKGNFLDKSTVFAKSVIRSRRAFTYSEAQALIDESTDQSESSLMLRKLLGLTKILRETRLKKGALSLDSPELRYELESETNDPVTLNIKESLGTNRLVEECMLLANILVAKKIYSVFPTLALLRSHSAPDQSKLNELYSVINRRFGNQDSNPRTLAEFLDNYVRKDDGTGSVVRYLSIFCLKQAIYICSGHHSYESFYHFGLAEEIYTHFTSPIRRYPDIMVHRLLYSSISDSESHLHMAYNPSIIEQMCEHLNRCHVSAQLAGRESVKLFLYTFLKNRKNVLEPMTAFVTKVLYNALSVYVPVYHHFGYIRFDPDFCKREEIIVDVIGGLIEDKKNKSKLRILDSVMVTISVNPDAFCFDGIKIELLFPTIHGISK
ncbi:Exosome complex exonuclease RRP44 [Thelohanellus kitauei]|uniref:Exosome complex exonuclease RRP44 n=1 Tax=Thelohanellus kitauei TaxID=669202 RepID=A0A0C2MRT0_THEKT|nr:Exosome complex exonuclease RRP44 [Thelohanellus kitauei]